MSNGFINDRFSYRHLPRIKKRKTIIMSYKRVTWLDLSRNNMFRDRMSRTGRSVDNDPTFPFLSVEDVDNSNDLYDTMDPLAAIKSSTTDEMYPLSSPIGDTTDNSNEVVNNLFSNPACFVDAWEDDSKLQETIRYTELVQSIFDPLKSFETRYGITIDGQNVFIVTEQLTGKSYVFKHDKGDKIGSGSYGDIRTLLFLDSDEWYIEKESRYVVIESTNWTDIGLVTKFISDQNEAKVEKAKIKYSTIESSTCCTIQERHLYENYFIMRRVDGDLKSFFKKYTPYMTNRPDDPHFMQRFTLSMVDRLRQMYLCIYNNGYRYFDIKLENIGYRIVTNRRGDRRPKIELIILDIGSVSTERYRIKDMNSVYTYRPPEWSRKMYDVRRLTSIQMNGRENGLSVLTDGIGNMIKKTYVWFLGLLLVDMFSYHKDFGSKMDIFFDEDADYGCYENNGDISKCDIVEFMIELFPPDKFPRIYTALMPFPGLRQLTLDEPWVIN